MAPPAALPAALLGRALAHAAWSLPWGLAAGLRAAAAAADHSSVVAGSPVRQAGMVATSVLAHALLLLVLSLTAGVVETLVRRLSPLDQGDGQHLAAAAALLAGGGLEAALLDTRRIEVAALSGVALLAVLAWLGARRRAAAPDAGLPPWRLASRVAHGAAGLAAGATAWLFLGPERGPAPLLATGLLAGAAGALASVTARALLPAPAARTRARLRGLTAAAGGSALLIAAGLAAASAVLPLVPPRHRVAGRPRLVLIVTVDTLRADAAPRGSVPTPALDRLAAESVTFTQCRAPSPWTDPSLDAFVSGGEPGWSLLAAAPEAFERRTVLTNRGGSRRHRPQYHGDVHETGDLEPLPLLAVRQLPVARRAARTKHRRFVFGLARADAVTEAAIGHLDAAGSGPLLLWVHYLDPHAPYDPPARFRDVPARDDLDALFSADFRRGAVRTPEQQRRLEALYRGEVRFVDEQVGRLLERVREKGLWEGATVVLTADHGEELFDHGEAGHGHSLFDELLRVPLVVKLPGGREAGRVVDEPVALADVAPTVVALVGGTAPSPSPHAGRDLGPLLAGGALGQRPQAFGDLLFGPERDGALDWPWKLIRDPARRRLQLHDLAADPSELHDRTAERPDVAGRLERLLDDLRPHGAPCGDAGAPDRHELDALRALGYVR